MITYADVKTTISTLSKLEQKAYVLSRQLEEKELQFEEMLMAADAEGVTKNDRQRKCFVESKKQNDVEYQTLRKELEKTKIETNFNSRMYQLELKCVGSE
jgi:hypothetical protein